MRASLDGTLLEEAIHDELEAALLDILKSRFTPMSIGLNSCKPISNVAILVNR
ncbi:hypothetical protein NDI48_19095 [Microcoleus sp. AS-A8]